MAYDGYVQFNDTELFNVLRTVQLSEALGIDTVWVTKESVDWIADATGEEDYDVISTAPWYDPGFPASAEFAGIMPLSITGLDDSTLESTPVEYVTDGGNAGKARNSTLPVVANVVVVASTERGAEFGKRWLDRVLRGDESTIFCVGSEIGYFRYAPPGGITTPGALPWAHRRDVKLTRGTSVTRKRSNSCSATWMVTFTLTAADPFEYGDPIPLLSGLGTWNAVKNPTGSDGAGGGSTAFWQTYGANTSLTSAAESGARFFIVSKTLAGSQMGIRTQQAPPGMTSFPAGKRVTLTAEVRHPPGQTVTSIGFIARDDTNGDSAVLEDLDGTLLTTVPADGFWHEITVTGTVKTGRALEAIYVYKNTSTAPLAEVLNVRNIDVSEFAEVPSPKGSLDIIQQSCPAYDYSPIYDPLYPALTPAPPPPSFYPTGWTIEDGDTFRRIWSRVPAVEPSSLYVVPRITLFSDVAARMVRVGIWSSEQEINTQCDPLFSAVVTYLPPGIEFVIDGEQVASYVDDGSAVVRRADSLVYSPDANPVQWASFNDAESYLVTLDVYENPDNLITGFEGEGTVRLTLDVIPKSD
jgi:hypothetical protein